MVLQSVSPHTAGLHRSVDHAGQKKIVPGDNWPRFWSELIGYFVQTLDKVVDLS